MFNKYSGFTLIEIIATIVISGFVGSMLVVFMSENINEGNKQIAVLGDSFRQESAMEVIFAKYKGFLSDSDSAPEIEPDDNDPDIDDALEKLIIITSGDQQSNTIADIRSTLSLDSSVPITLTSYYCTTTISGNAITVSQYTDSDPSPSLVRVVVGIGNTSALLSRLYGVE